jgi:ABC-type nitrate/sulfonate/bicarbonate transport system permease component
MTMAMSSGRLGSHRMCLLCTTRWFPACLGALVLLASWAVLAATWGARHFVIPQPHQVLIALVINRFYLDNLLVTGWEAARGFVAGNLIALALAAFCLLLPGARKTVTRLAAASYCVPAVAVAPLLAVLLDMDRSKVIVSALSVVFTTTLGTVLGLSNATSSSLDLVHANGGGPLFALWHVRLRAAASAMVGALALSAPAAVLGAIVAEFLGGDAGIGVAMVSAQRNLQIPSAWGLAVVATGASALAYLGISLLGKRLRFAVVTSDAPDRRVPDAQGPHGHRGLSHRIAAAGGRVCGAVLGTALAWWALLTLLDLDPYLAKTPVDIYRYLMSVPNAAGNRELILGGLLTTLRDCLGGYLAGTVLGVLLAVAMVGSPFAEAMFMPVAVAMQATPLVAVTPLVGLVFGRGVLGVVVLATAITVVPTLVNVLAAVRAVPAPALDLARAHGMGWLRSVSSIRLRYALPALAMSARIAIPGALLGATIAEYLITLSGLGWVISMALVNSDLITLWTAVTVVTATAVTLFSLLTWLETAALRRLAG